ncbi:hypothetical protein JZ751_006889 [Albula glossodonta]|uniref:Uncharacterized protein n=1 Tax=Albula glossodonta TaxID=121402 RepID=A0A8T2PAN9_9TELE|nr:hypothetical protein JZ751_006889 [Albula glossodonta]
MHCFLPHHPPTTSLHCMSRQLPECSPVPADLVGGVWGRGLLFCLPVNAPLLPLTQNGCRLCMRRVSVLQQLPSSPSAATPTSRQPQSQGDGMWLKLQHKDGLELLLHSHGRSVPCQQGQMATGHSKKCAPSGLATRAAVTDTTSGLMLFISSSNCSLNRMALRRGFSFFTELICEGLVDSGTADPAQGELPMPHGS